MTIKDSGQRTRFESGAVRDIQEGKGRCDLLPFDVVKRLYRWDNHHNQAAFFSKIDRFVESGNSFFLCEAVGIFTDESDFVSWSDMLLEVSKHFEDGCKKYGENNWKKGIPVRRYIDSAVRHYLKWCREDHDEPHDRAVCWNLMCAIWTCMNKPELNEYAKEGIENE